MRYLSHSISDVGLKREINQDRLLSVSDKGLYIVADGMGGGLHGEVAAQIAVETVQGYVTRNFAIAEGYKVSPTDENRNQVLKMLASAAFVANSKVYKEASYNRSSKQMGTTLTVLLTIEDTGFMVHAGDSRLYLVRNNVMSQISTDHNMKQDYMKKYGEIPDDIDSSYIDMLTKALGIAEILEPEIVSFSILPKDTFIIASDGAYFYFDSDDSVPGEILFTDNDNEDQDARLSKVCENMQKLAYDGGAHDNLSAIIITAIETGNEKSNEIFKQETLKNVTLFKDLSYSELLKILEKAKLRTHNKYDIILTESESLLNRELFILIEGQVSIIIKSKIVAMLGPGEHFGEISLLDEGPVSASVFVDKPSTFLVISKGDILEIINDYPQIGVKLLWEISAALSGKLRATSTLLVN